jgi:hypothetical protein
VKSIKSTVEPAVSAMESRARKTTAVESASHSAVETATASATAAPLSSGRDCQEATNEEKLPKSAHKS